MAALHFKIDVSCTKSAPKMVSASEDSKALHRGGRTNKLITCVPCTQAKRKHDLLLPHVYN